MNERWYLWEHITEVDTKRAVVGPRLRGVVLVVMTYKELVFFITCDVPHREPPSEISGVIVAITGHQQHGARREAAGRIYPGRLAAKDMN